MFQSEAMPNCGIQVVYSDQQVDPYIDTALAGMCKIDTAMDLAAFSAKTGGDPTSLIKNYSAQLQTPQAVTTSYIIPSYR